MAILNIGQDFGRDPTGRGPRNGPLNGEAFREKLLKPAVDKLQPGEKLMIILDDGVDGYGSSFLSEGFGGMIKCGYIKSDKFLSILEFKYNDPDFLFFEKRIVSYIKETPYNSNK
ncbi:DUF4325 domain-containing protein [Alcanivorax sp. VBW004]|uniref:STAS-like domain-containing protein n=1 Tax=Alcanivorax sp. VBW004 TaxID=1287708 RepID=UPI0012BB4A01|nr:STAS-like domain-containing protein [Alcanivorax sp. VBW004]MTT52992.1 DUF4325 domain-containing protein [Alcanivorax sp. VBW004]